MNIFISISNKINGDCLINLNQGDIIVVYYNNKLLWGVIDSLINENKLRIFETLYVTSFPDFGNKIIFSYDAITKRQGCVEVLTYLQEAFKNKIIQSFIGNLLDILSYKEDRIDSEIYIKFFSDNQCYHELDVFYSERKSQVLVKEPSIEEIGYKEIEKKNIIIKHMPESYLFYDFLDIKCQELWVKYYSNEEYKMRDIFNLIRKSYPQLFSSALKAFNAKNEHGNIYKLK